MPKPQTPLARILGCGATEEGEPWPRIDVYAHDEYETLILVNVDSRRHVARVPLTIAGEGYLLALLQEREHERIKATPEYQERERLAREVLKNPADPDVVQAYLDSLKDIK